MERTSARVGVGFVIMDSSMLVATMTGFPRFRQPCTIFACQNGTCTRYTVNSKPASDLSNSDPERIFSNFQHIARTLGTHPHHAVNEEDLSLQTCAHNG